MRNVLYWTPRVLGLLFGFFLAVLALDVLGKSEGFVATLIGFIVHLVPAAIAFVILLIAWRWEWIGAALYGAVAFFYAITLGRRHLSWILFVSGPLALLATLFLVSWLARSRSDAVR